MSNIYPFPQGEQRQAVKKSIQTTNRGSAHISPKSSTIRDYPFEFK